jgi:guanylate kinase
MKSNPDKFICFVTGASGVGKSTLAGHLKSKYGERKDVTILGFDSIGIPSVEEMTEKFGSPTEFQRIATKQWVDKILRDIEEPIIILEGQMNFDYIHEAFDHHKFKNWKAILIDCDEKEMMRRLKQERGQPELANEEMKNWRKHLRKQAEERNAPVINTAGLTEEEVLQKLEEILGDILN